jgi:DNA-binding CsgD family transcriptional regulator
MCIFPGDCRILPAEFLVPGQGSSSLRGKKVIVASLDEVFVGRDSELAEMERALGKARAGSGSIMILSGEAGIGKTRTAGAFAARARARGARVLWGHCYEGEECPPFGPWIAALRQHACSTAAATLRDQMGDGATDIACILPELRRIFPDLETPMELPFGEGEQLLYHSLFVFFRAICLRTPLVVVLDNLHLADAASLKLLRHFSHELAGSRVVVIGTHRNPRESLRDPLAMTLEELSKGRACPRMQLEGLSPGEVAEFLRRALPVAPSPAVATAIYSRTEGNPLFLVELARQLRSESAVTRVTPGLPLGIRQAIARRLRMLSNECRGVLSTAAVLGRSFEREALCRMIAGACESQVTRALEEALAASILSGDSGPVERYRFLHGLVRESLLEEIPLPRLPALHLQAGLALQEIPGTDPGARAAEIVSHLLEAPGHANPDDLVLWTLRASQDAARRYAPQQAVATIDRTRRVLDGRGQASDGRIAALLFRRGQSLGDLQRPEEARENMLQAFDLFVKAADTRGALDVAFTPAWTQGGASEPGVWFWSSAPGGLPELRERALALVAPESIEYARLLAQRGSRADLRRALDFSRRHGAAQLEAASMAHLAYHELLAWDFGACARILTVAVPLAERLQDMHVLFSVHYSRFFLGMLTGDSAAAASALESLFADARRSRSQRILVAAHRCAADFAQYQGRWSDARMHGAQALKFLSGTGPVFNHIQTLWSLVKTELDTGHLKAARRYCAQLARTSGIPEDADIRTIPLGARVTGDASHLGAAPLTMDTQDCDGPLMTFVTSRLINAAQVIALCSDALLAPRCLQSLLHWKSAFLGRSTDGLIAALCSLLGRRAEAAEHFEEALCFCRRAGYWPELAWTCLDYGEALSRGGDDADHRHALLLLEEGLERSQALGMTPLSRLILAAHARLTGAARRLPVMPDGLTRREVDVVRLIAKGFTNAEIADRLFISQVTVAKHVHNLLEKTGMANRAEAAVYAARSGLDREVSCRPQPVPVTPPAISPAPGSGA